MPDKELFVILSGYNYYYSKVQSIIMSYYLTYSNTSIQREREIFEKKLIISFHNGGLCGYITEITESNQNSRNLK